MRKYKFSASLTGNSQSPLCSNIAEQLIEKGLAGVVRHKRDDEDRSPDFDKFMAAEQASVLSQFPNAYSQDHCATGLSPKREAFIPERISLHQNNP